MKATIKSYFVILHVLALLQPTSTVPQPTTISWLRHCAISRIVLLGSILANNQRDILFRCIYLFHLSTCFEQPSAHHQENQLYQYIIRYVLKQLILLTECWIAQNM